MNSLRFISFLLIMGVVVLGCSGTAKDKGDVLATFNGGTVSQEEFTEAVQNLPERVKNVVVRQKKDFLESFVIEKLLFQEAERRGIQHREDIVELLEKARQKILVAKLVEEEVEKKAAVTPDEVSEYYAKNKEEFMNPFRLKASHILVRSREEADDVIMRLGKGEDFADLAKEASLDPTGPKGGDLGYFQKGQLIPEIEEAAFALDNGQVSDVIQTSFGFHVLKITDLVQPLLKEFNSVEKEIEEKLALELKSKYFTDLTEGLKSKADISINEELLSRFELEPNASS
jgi:peptidyl-prolyl cis-trans isomerase C